MARASPKRRFVVSLSPGSVCSRLSLSSPPRPWPVDEAGIAEERVGHVRRPGEDVVAAAGIIQNRAGVAVEDGVLERISLEDLILAPLMIREPPAGVAIDNFHGPLLHLDP
jgi:hypothetical protein